LQDGKFFESIKSAAVHYNIRNSRIRNVLKGESTQTGGRSFVFSKSPLSHQTCETHLQELKERREREMARRKAGSRSRAVVCVTTGETFRNGVAAGRYFGCSQSRISQACRNGDLIHNCLRFRYIDSTAVEKKRRSSDQIARQKTASLAALKRGVEKNRKRVVCLDTGERFASITEAARSCGASVTTVSDAIHRRGRAYGLRFAFEENS
jgi:hypothetical protein